MLQVGNKETRCRFLNVVLVASALDSDAEKLTDQNSFDHLQLKGKHDMLCTFVLVVECG